MATIVSAQPPSLARLFNPFALARHLWRQRDLIRQFTRREIEGRYRGSFLGLFWSFINPLVMLLIYTFVFGIIFKARWPEARTGSLGEFAVVLFCGLTAFSVFSETVTRAPSLITNVPNYVKKVVFPLEILPVTSLGSSLFHSGISFIILIAAHLLTGGTLYWTILLLPLVLIPMICLTVGLSWFLASLGVFIRDIPYLVALVVQILFFLTPIFYPVDSIPEPLRTVIALNPMSATIADARRIILWGQLPEWSSLLVALVIGLVVMMAGYVWFMKTRKAFADVI